MAARWHALVQQQAVERVHDVHCSSRFRDLKGFDQLRHVRLRLAFGLAVTIAAVGVISTAREAIIRCHVLLDCRRTATQQSKHTIDTTNSLER